MYTEFYNLKEKPFTLSPSSKYLYLGDIHKEALALLTYGVIERMGFILLTGEVGTGKTTMVHALLNSLGDDVQHVYLSNPLFSVNDFMDYLAFSAFKKKVHFQSKADFLIQFEAFLKEQLQNQKNFILIIDEAQKLSIELLEEIRLLSNMETADEKLINIFLIGQPELNDTLNSMECRPLLQRISVRYHIKPLDQKGTGDYILARLRMAGVEDGTRIFSRNTIKEIYKCSGGFPRMINILADNILLLGYSRGEKKLTPGMVKECYNDLQLSGSPLGRPEIVEAGQRPNELPVDSNKSGRTRSIIFLILIIIAAVFGGIFGKSIYLHLSDISSVDKSTTQSDRIEGKSPSQQQGKNTEVNIPDKIVNDSPIRSASSNNEGNKIRTENNSLQDNDGLSNELNDDERIDETITTDIPSSMDDSIIVPEPEVKTITVTEGATLEGLAMKVYGYANDSVLDLIKENNPEITNINLIATGQIIKFPPLEESSSNQIFTVHIASFTPFESARDLFNDLISKGYEAYIIPVYNKDKEKVFRVTVGSFNNKNKAGELAREIKEKGISSYTNVIKLETQ